MTAVSWGVTDPFFTEFSIDQFTCKFKYYKILLAVYFLLHFLLLGNVLFVLFFFVFVLSGNKTIYEAIKHRYVFKKVSPQLKKIKEKH